MIRKILNVSPIVFVSLYSKLCLQNNLCNTSKTYFIKYSTQISETSVPLETVQKLSKQRKIIVIDVRSSEEFEQGEKIQDSINIPLHEVVHALNYLNDEEFMMKYGIPCPLYDSPIVFVCEFGLRSSLALQSALDLGYKEVKFCKIPQCSLK